MLDNISVWIFVGIAFTIIGNLVTVLLYNYTPDSENRTKFWSSLFVSGFILAFIGQLTGMSKYYCKNYC